MDEIFDMVRVKSKIRVILGVLLILIGLIIHLIPLVPGSWLIFIGLEVLGIRLVVREKIFKFCNRSSIVYQIRSMLVGWMKKGRVSPAPSKM